MDGDGTACDPQQGPRITDKDCPGKKDNINVRMVAKIGNEAYAKLVRSAEGDHEAVVKKSHNKKKFAHSRDAYQRFLATWPDETDRLPGSVRGLRDRQAFERVRRDREMTKQPSSVVTAATQTAS